MADRQSIVQLRLSARGKQAFFRQTSGPTDNSPAFSSNRESRLEIIGQNERTQWATKLTSSSGRESTGHSALFYWPFKNCQKHYLKLENYWTANDGWPLQGSAEFGMLKRLTELVKRKSWTVGRVSTDPVVLAVCSTHCVANWGHRIVEIRQRFRIEARFRHPPDRETSPPGRSLVYWLESSDQKMYIANRIKSLKKEIKPKINFSWSYPKKLTSHCKVCKSIKLQELSAR